MRLLWTAAGVSVWASDFLPRRKQLQVVDQGDERYIFVPSRVPFDREIQALVAGAIGRRLETALSA